MSAENIINMYLLHNPDISYYKISGDLYVPAL